MESASLKRMLPAKLSDFKVTEISELDIVINTIYNMVMPVFKDCIQCGIEFKVPPSDGNQKFCTNTCYGIYQRKPPKTEKCSVESCSNIVLSMSLCNRHYLRKQRYGHPTEKLKPYKRKNYYKKKGYRNKKKPYILKKGYKKILIPFHPRADTKGYVFEHIIILEAKLGRTLQEGEVTHHTDGDKLNNDPSNIIVVINNSQHIKKYHPHGRSINSK